MSLYGCDGMRVCMWLGPCDEMSCVRAAGEGMTPQRCVWETETGGMTKHGWGVTEWGRMQQAWARDHSHDMLRCVPWHEGLHEHTTLHVTALECIDVVDVWCLHALVLIMCCVRIGSYSTRVAPDVPNPFCAFLHVCTCAERDIMCVTLSSVQPVVRLSSLPS